MNRPPVHFDRGGGMGENGGFASQDDQARYLQDANTNVKRAGYHMQQAMDGDSLREALRHSAAMLSELRTSYLTPQKYFELYMQVFDKLTQLEAFFKEEHAKGRSYTDLYELVQHAGNVVPRLYLLCTVGACFIRSKEANAKDILKDLVEMCKGVQHPTRGLFLRSYLCQVSRGLLPDTGSEYEGEGGNLNDAVEFLLVNFTEMNKLWVRMQHQGSVRDKERRERERQQLADLVGKNLTYLSQLEGLDFELYKETVRPRIMEQVVACKDDIAQQYLMQCIIQGFPDEFHLGSLDALLDCLPQLQPGLKVHIVLSSLLDRLARYAISDKSVMASFVEVDAFGKLVKAAVDVAEQHAEMSGADVTSMFIALIDFAGTVFPDKLKYVNRLLSDCYKALQSRGTDADQSAEKQLTSLLTVPLDKYPVVTVLGLSHYPSVMNLLPPATRKEIAVKIVQTIIKQDAKIGSLEKSDMLLNFISPLIQDTEGVEEDDDEEFAEEQNLVARLIQQLQAEDSDDTFAVLRSVRERMRSGGGLRLRHTLPAIAFSGLQLIPEIKSRELAGEKVEATCKLVLQFLHGVAAELAEVGDQECAEMALHMFLTATHSSSELAGLELITYEFFEQAFIIYEESIPDSNAEKRALHSIVGALQQCYILSPDSRETLVHKATGYSAKLLRKADQCRAVCACSHLFWQSIPLSQEDEEEDDEEADQKPVSGSKEENQAGVRDGAAVLNCLKRALKIAHASQQQLALTRKSKDTTPVLLFVEILNKYLYFFDQDVPAITADDIKSLLELISTEMASEHCQLDEALSIFFKNTLEHIKLKRDASDANASKYGRLQA